MKKRTLAIGAIAVAAVLASGWALAQSVGPSNGFGPSFMQGQGSDGMGRGMTKGMHHRMGPGMMKGEDETMGYHGKMKGMGGHGPGMMQGMGPGTMRGGQDAPR